RARRGFGGELREAREDVGHLAERLLTDRQRGDAVVGVADRLGGDAHVALELVGDREAGGLVGGVVDAEPGRQPLERRGEAVARRPFLERWLAEGRAGEMDYLGRRMAERMDPRTAFPWARSIVSLAYPYRPPPPPAGDWRAELRGRIAAYALGVDYHDRVRAL